jgi:hypothetical protein
MLKALRIALMISITSTSEFAAGWSDFSSDIGQGFVISKMNSLQVCLGFKESGLLLILNG